VAANLRNTPVDRRRLSPEERQSYRGGARAKANARTRQTRGAIVQQRNRMPFATEQKPGTGGFTAGPEAQQLRTKELGEDKARQKSLRPTTDMSMYDIYN
jgi:hypothetical protein